MYINYSLKTLNVVFYLIGVIKNKKRGLQWNRKSHTFKMIAPNVFSRKHLSRHENLVHSKSIKKWSCTCLKAFSGKDALDRHKKKCNGSVKGTLSSIYSEKVHQSWQLKCHMEQKHRSGLTWSRCKKTYKKKKLSENHLQLCSTTAS